VFAVPHEATARRVAEHHQILAATSGGDPEEAARLMREHVHASHQRFREAVEAASAGAVLKPLKRNRVSSAAG
jgi:DNA-binding GntR family transcriptional regulator